MAPSSTMNGGDGVNSYQKNSTLQRDGFEAAKKVINEAILNNLDIEKLLSDSTTFAIADLGCSVGPNTFFAMQTIIETVQRKLHSHCEFQVFFNDQISNDFNTLFASLPQPRSFFAAAVPGSFYGRLFPSSSIHVAFSSSSLHWLSRVPPALQARDSPAWNPGMIHYTGGASDAVVKAYADQYEEDMEVFLRARGEEIVEGGMVIMIMPGVPDEVLTHDVGIAITFLGCILMDMVKEGVMLSQEKVDALNVPHVYPSMKQMRRAVEKNGYFEIVKMEIRNARSDLDAPIDIEGAVMHLRALIEGTIANHLSSEIVDELFKRAVEQRTKFARMLFSAGIQPGSQLFAVLKRK